jgi:hypothetical protein
MFSDFKATCRTALRLNHEVLYFLIIDFNKGEADLKRLGRTLKFFNTCKDLIASNRNNTLIASISDLIYLE